MSDSLTTEDRRRVIFKKTVVMEDLRLPRYHRVHEVRKIKKDKDLAERRAVATADQHNIRQRVQQDGLMQVVTSLLSMPEQSEANRSLGYLCDVRPVELVNALPIFVEGTNSSNDTIKERATRCLSRLAKVDQAIRDKIIEQDGFLEALNRNILNPTPGMCVACLDLILNLLSYNKLPSLAVSGEWRNFLCVVLFNADPDNASFNMLVSVLRALNCFSKYDNLCFDDPILHRLVQLVARSEHQLVEPAMTTLANVVASSRKSATLVLDAGVLDHVKRLLKEPKLQACTCNFLSEIALAAPEHHHKLLKSGTRSIFRQLSAFVHGDYCSYLKEKSLNIIIEVLKHGRDIHIYLMEEANCIVALSVALETTWNLSIVKGALEALFVVLGAGDRLNTNYLYRLTNFGLEKNLEALEAHPNPVVSNMSSILLTKYFNRDDYEEEENFLPTNCSEAHSKSELANECNGPPEYVSSFGTVITKSTNT